MEINFTTIVTLLDIYPSEDGLRNVVKRVHWKVFAFDNNQKYYETIGIYECATPSTTDFTAYDNLTNEIVLGWVSSEVNFSMIKNELSNKINLANNPTININLPWSNETDIVPNLPEPPKEEVIIEEENPIIDEENEVIEEKEVILEPKTI
jgi:hypothetical protein